ncbi:metalloregulator ArsR/SmtB family transcription factor [Paenibacillus sp. FSL M7-1455]|jgi:DNA-binding transcriptional ArsR family regulator|uniref:Transcriptional regulator n=1 Tax=Paenibacillus cookii TaxID=157839 RepID=A0ABQ4M012_9BACL|nr:metalloregulator ArsR/SmtB family transcription factor [Paenibacillus cookii]KHF37543.1 Helix-turn-helix domain protein [Paenibacillus sp. P1XP2]GIO68874.1 transcriptional regulator [Paenibacillus cookii]HWO55448.1 metalloregulator ArsR/SmtB family transcription factor [Paenibacillus cookii]
MTIKLSKEDEKRAKIFKALSEVKRIEMIRYLRAHRSNNTCGTIGEAMGMDKSNVSYHLKILYEADLIDVSRAGQNRLSQLKEDTFNEFLPGFLDTL